MPVARFKLDATFIFGWVVAPQSIPFAEPLTVAEGTICARGNPDALLLVIVDYVLNPPPPFLKGVAVGSVVPVEPDPRFFIGPKSYTEDTAGMLFEKRNTRLDFNLARTPPHTEVRKGLMEVDPVGQRVVGRLN